MMFNLFWLPISKQIAVLARLICNKCCLLVFWVLAVLARYPCFIDGMLPSRAMNVKKKSFTPAWANGCKMMVVHIWWLLLQSEHLEFLTEGCTVFRRMLYRLSLCQCSVHIAGSFEFGSLHWISSWKAGCKYSLVTFKCHLTAWL